MTIKANKIGLVAFAAVLALFFYWRHNTVNNDPIAAATVDSVSMRALLVSAIAAAQLGGHQVQRQSQSMHSLNVRTKGKTQEGANDPVTDADLRSHCAMSARLLSDHPTVRVRSEEEADDGKCAQLPPLVGDNNSHTDAKWKNKQLLAEHTTLAEAMTVGIDEQVPIGDVTIWIDPLDATQEFTEVMFQYVTVMVCVAVRGQPTIGVIHNPFTHDTHWAWHRPSLTSSTLHDTSPPAPAILSPPAHIEPTKRAANHTVIVSRSHYGSVSQLILGTIGADTQLVYAGGAGYKVLQVAEGRADAYVHSTRIKKWDLCAGNAILAALGGRLSDLHGGRIDYGATADAVNELGVLGVLNEHEWFVQRLRGKV